MSDGDMLSDFWYPALRSAQLPPRKLEPVVFLGAPLVIGRDDRGVAFALRDTCPHQGMPLSFGHLDGSVLECCYHGWRFETSTGQCRGIPSLVSGSRVRIERIFATRYPCEEQDGYIWVYMPDPASSGQPVPPVPRLPVFSSRYRLIHLWAELPCGVDRAVMMLLDFAHGAFVHRPWFWRRTLREKEKIFEPTPGGFRIRPVPHSVFEGPYKLFRRGGQTVTTAIEFMLPSTRLESIHRGSQWFSNRVTITPVTGDRCRIDFCAAWNLFLWVPFAGPLFSLFGRVFLRDDVRNMKKLAIGLRHDPATMLIDDVDRPTQWYFRLKAAHLQAKHKREPLQHPLQDPVALRWRT